MTPDDDIRRLLDAIPAPNVEPVDVAAIYRDAAAIQARSARRWKRATCAGALVAASVLLVAILPKLEVKVTGSEFVVRWGPADPPPVQPAPVVHDESVIARLGELDAHVTRTVHHEKKLKDLEDLLLTLAVDVDDRDGKRKAELAALARDLRLLRSGTQEQFQQTEKTNAALYAAIFDKPQLKE